ncbi:hypothetical protein HMPREF9700_01249 [Bergeyella zoohelcum CCUG 30536]|nr:hypothetical protein HMPREF9700_01249 [Bergeyella zoohelcum CCUG 30536]
MDAFSPERLYNVQRLLAYSFLPTAYSFLDAFEEGKESKKATRKISSSFFN